MNFAGLQWKQSSVARVLKSNFLPLHKYRLQREAKSFDNLERLELANIAAEISRKNESSDAYILFELVGTTMGWFSGSCHKKWVLEISFQ